MPLGRDFLLSLCALCLCGKFFGFLADFAGDIIIDIDFALLEESYVQNL